MNLAWDRALAAGRLRAVVHDGLWFHLSTPPDLAEAEAVLHEAGTGEIAMNLFTLPPDAAVPGRDRRRTGCARAGTDEPLASARRADPAADPARGAGAGRGVPARLRRAAPCCCRASPRSGALDEAPLALAGALDLPPAVEPAQRLAALARLILAMGGDRRRARAPPTAPGRWRRELAALMDEAERGGDRPRRPPAGGRRSGVRRALGGDAGVPAHRHRHLAALAGRAGADEPGRPPGGAARRPGRTRGSGRPPEDPVLAAGTTGGHPGGGAAGAGRGAAAERARWCCPVWTLALDEAAWAALDESHPQAGLRRLLDRLGATRATCGSGRCRAAAMRRTLLGRVPVGRMPLDGRAPACRRVGSLCCGGRCCRGRHCTTGRTGRRTRTPPCRPVPPRPRPTRRRKPPRSRWSCATRWKRPGARAALVTPDRALAGTGGGRAAALRRDRRRQRRREAGRNPARRVPAPARPRASPSELAPVPLLALLKHPLAAAGLAPAACRAAARALELASCAARARRRA